MGSVHVKKTSFSLHERTQQPYFNNQPKVAGLNFELKLPKKVVAKISLLRIERNSQLLVKKPLIKLIYQPLLC